MFENIDKEWIIEEVKKNKKDSAENYEIKASKFKFIEVMGYCFAASSLYSLLKGDASGLFDAVLRGLCAAVGLAASVFGRHKHEKYIKQSVIKQFENEDENILIEIEAQKKPKKQGPSA